VNRLYVVLVLAYVPWLVAADWPQFRGPGGAGVSDAVGLPTTWSDAENIVWKVELPGYGASSPITWGDRIFVSGYSGYGVKELEGAKKENLERRIACVNRKDGSILWNKSFPSKADDNEYSGFTALHGYASATPVTDGECVFAYFGKTGLVACDMDGGLLWQADCGDKTHGFGSGASPALFENLVIVNACVESKSLIAFDKKTGKQAWEVEGIDAAWNTPLVVEADGKHELVLSMKNKLVAYDPATGDELWTCDGIKDYVCPSVIHHNGIVYAIGGRGRVGLAVKTGGRGDVTETHRLYELKRGSNVSSPVLYDGHLYWAHESSGIVYCANAETGEVLYEKRLDPRPGRIYASPVCADGKLYYVSRDKGTFVLAAEPEYKLLAHNVLESDKSIFNASPVVSGNSLLLRSDQYLYCIGKE
jgi:hypothetical protein